LARLCDERGWSRRHFGPHCPTDDAARIQVEYHGDIQPAFRRPDIGEVGKPFPVRRIGDKFALQRIRRNAVLTARAGVVGSAAALWPGRQAGRLHQPGNPVDAALVNVAPGYVATVTASRLTSSVDFLLVRIGLSWTHDAI